jgi:site-specific recombinase XerD
MEQASIESSKIFECDLLKLCPLFIQDLKTKSRSINTLKNYQTDLDCFKEYLMQKTGKTEFGHFGLSEILEYGKYLQQKYSSDNSRRRRVQTLRNFFDFLVAQNLFGENPVRKIPVSPKFVDIPRPAHLIDLKTLWAHLLEQYHQDNLVGLTAKRNLVLFTLIYNTGLKVSDLAKLKREQILMGEQPRILVTPPRRDPYTIPLPSAFSAIYPTYLKELEEWQVKSRLNFEELFFNANPYHILSGGLSSRGMELIFQDWRKKLMIKVTPKSMRQAGIYLWIHEGLNDLIIKERLGLAPSYSMKPYRESAPEHVYNSDFQLEFLEQKILH